MDSRLQIIQKTSAGRRRDLTGRRFGRLTALEPVGRAADNSIVWRCRCQCGNISLVSSSKLLQGTTVSCGCYGQECLRNSRT